MIVLPKLALSEKHHRQLHSHLFPGDGMEAAAILLCARSSEHRFVVSQVLLVPYQDCAVRLSNYISWPGLALETAIDSATPNSLSMILIHSHPGGLFGFSEVDNKSDREVMPGLFEAFEPPLMQHGSAIMTPDGAIRARLYDHDMQVIDIDSVLCAADDISIWQGGDLDLRAPSPMAFSADMGKDLKKLTVCVVGVSGTGSIVSEQLARLGIGRLILIDFDLLELKNLNRILNSTLEDVKRKAAKVDVLSSVIKTYRNDIEVLTLKASITEREAIILAGQADVLFCCVDSFEGRQICDRVAAAFIQPLFDVAVTIPTRLDGSKAAIGDVCGRIDYVKPGGASLADRKVYSPEVLRREYLQRVAPEEYCEQVDEGYFKGVVDEAPSVISLNMRAASDCVMEFIARLYPFRQDPNTLRARTLFSLAASDEDHFSEEEFCRKSDLPLGIGLIEPLLDMPCFDQRGVSK
jgi:hypothetical protein